MKRNPTDQRVAPGKRSGRRSVNTGLVVSPVTFGEDAVRELIHDRIAHPRLGKRARLVVDAHNAKVIKFYSEFGAFTKEVLPAFNRLRDILPEHEVDALIGQVVANRIEATCRAVRRATERLEEFWEAQPTIQPAQPDREHRLQQFRKDHKTTIAAVREAAEVHKPEMQNWRHGELPNESVMSQRIEEVLSGRRPLKPRRTAPQRHQGP